MSRLRRVRNIERPRPTCEPVEGRLLLAQVTWTGDGDGSSWADGANWSTQQIPQTGDEVLIGPGGDPVNFSGTVSLTSLTVDRTLRFSGDMTLLNASAILILESTGGTMAVGSQVVVSSFLWSNLRITGGGTFASSQTLITGAGNGREVYGATFRNNGSVQQNSAPLNLAFTLNQPTSLVNAGTWTMTGNASIGVGPSNPATFHGIGGTLVKSGAGDANLNLPISGSGSVDVQGGSLGLNRDTSVPWAVTLSGGDLRISSADVDFGSKTIEGDGYLRVSGGKARFAGLSRVENLGLTGGELNLEATQQFIVRQRLDVAGTATIFSGVMFIDSGASATFSGTSAQILGTQLYNEGTVVQSGGQLRVGNSVFAGLIQNILPGTWQLRSGAGLFTTSASPDVSFRNLGGRLEKQDAQTSTLSLPLHNLGQLIVVAGRLTLIAATTLKETGSAFVSVESGATLRINAPTSAAANAFLGNGTVLVEHELELQDGPTSIRNLTLEGSGVIRGAGTLSITGSFVWTAGTMRGAGVTRIEAGATATLTGNSPKRITERTLQVHGTVTHSGGPVQLGADNASPVTVEIEPGGVWRFGTFAGFLGAFGTAHTVINRGTIEKDAAGSTTGNGVEVRNVGPFGTIRVIAGTLLLSRPVRHGGLFETLLNTELRFSGHHQFDPQASFEGSGTASFENGAVSFEGRFAGSTGLTLGTGTSFAFESGAFGDVRQVSLGSDAVLELPPAPDTPTYFLTTSLSLSATSRVNVGGATFVYRPPAGPEGAGDSNEGFESLYAQVLSARNNGQWNGFGIGSSYAGSATNLTLGVGRASVIGAAGGSVGGVPVDPDDVLVRATRLGDTDLDRSVGFTDLLRLAQSFGLSPARYDQGDGNYSGAVDFTDLLELAQGFGQSAQRGGAHPPRQPLWHRVQEPDRHA